MDRFADLTSAQLLRPGGFHCACGRTHSVDIRQITIRHDLLPTLPSVLSEIGFRFPFVVCGPNGFKAAGETVCGILKAAGIAYRLHIVPERNGERVLPNEFSVGSITMAFDPACDVILGVGSGVINDLCKVIGKAVGRPNMIVGTAPSMDGYASGTSAMEVNNIKCSLTEQLPSVILCDVDLMRNAPMKMLWAGLGDMAAKYCALCEWKIAHLVIGEYYCEEIAALVQRSLDKVIENAPKIPERDPEAIASIADGLILSGIGMAFAGISRPASGLEHYFSHGWEMMDLARGKLPELHGIQVGIGTLLTLKICEHLHSIRPTMEHAFAQADAFDPVKWEANIRRVFADTADGIIAMERKARKNDRDGRMQRARILTEHWDEILSIIDTTLPSYEQLYTLMKQVGAPTHPRQIGISDGDVIDAFICSRDIRDKYLVSSLLWDIGYMDESAGWLRKELNAMD